MAVPKAPQDTPSPLPTDTAVAREDAEGHAQLILESFIPYRLSVLSNRMSQTIAGLYQKRFGLAVTEWRVMAVLGRFSGLSANEVAERTAMDKVAVSRAVARLLERDLIRREIHSDDRRRSVLALSEVGYSVYDEIVPLAEDCERRLLAALEEGERTTLARLLDKLAGPGLAALREDG